MPFSSAATSANGLNDEPAWRPVLPPGRQVHAAVAGGGVPVVGVLAADHRPDVARPGIDHGHRAVGVARIGEHRADGALGGQLQVGIDRGRDAQPAGEQQLVAVLPRLAERGVRKEPLLEVVDEVRERVRDSRDVNACSSIGSATASSRSALVIMRLLEHLTQDVVAPHPRVDGMGERVEVVRRADQAGEQRGLRQRQVLRVDRRSTSGRPPGCRRRPARSTPCSGTS